jgi:hypothetical protein
MCYYNAALDQVKKNSTFNQVPTLTKGKPDSSDVGVSKGEHRRILRETTFPTIAKERDDEPIRRSIE